jgi:mono/diheme cytochrome c family protein
MPAIRFWLILIAFLWFGSLAAAGLYFIAGLRSSTTPPSYFTPEQVREGSLAYAQHCASCHGAALEGANAPALVGQEFWEGWGNKTVAALYEYNSRWMPQGRGGSLSGEIYETTTAFMLAENGLPSGEHALLADEMARLNTLVITKTVANNQNVRDNVTATTVRRPDVGAVDVATRDAASSGTMTSQQSMAQQSTVQQTEVSSTAAPSSGATLTEAELYAQNCARCHSDNGVGEIGPSLVNNPRLEDAAWTIRRIAIGGLGMPAYGYRLTNEQLAGVTNYIRTNFENSYGEVTLQEVTSIVEQLPQTEVQPAPANLETASLGQQRYTQLCTACHGLQGGGGGGPPLAGNSDVGDERNVITILLYGRGAMPGFAQYGDDTVAAISSYIRTEWGNNYSTISETQVQQYRTTSSGGNLLEQPNEQVPQSTVPSQSSNAFEQAESPDNEDSFPTTPSETQSDVFGTETVTPPTQNTTNAAQETEDEQ